jgi:hypothetical protein
MAAWALSVLQAQDPELWAAELAYASACPEAEMDEVRQRWCRPAVLAGNSFQQCHFRGVMRVL